MAQQPVMSWPVDALTWLMNQVGYAVCHQYSQRTLAYGDRVLPVCARDTGVFLGFSLCFVLLLLVYGPVPRGYPSRLKVFVLGLLIVPTVFDAVSSYAGIRSSNNAVRLITGAMAGAGLAALLFPLAVTRLLRKEEPHERPAAFQSWWSMLLAPAAAAGVSLLLWGDWPGAYWLWAPLVTLSILFTLLVLNLLLVSFLLDWLRPSGLRPGTAVVGTLALAACLLELVVSNRLHWLVERCL